MVSDTLIFWCSWFKYMLIKLDLVTVGKFCFHFSRVLGSVADCVSFNSSARVGVNHALRDAQNACALTIVGTVLTDRTFPTEYKFSKNNLSNGNFNKLNSILSQVTTGFTFLSSLNLEGTSFFIQCFFLSF